MTAVLTDTIFKNMVAELEQAVADGKSPTVYELNVYVYGPQVASRSDRLDFKLAWVNPQETDIASAPAELTQQAVADQLKKLYGDCYRSNGMSPWRSWAAQILTLEQHEVEAAIVAGMVPDNVLHQFQTPDLAGDVKFKRRMAHLDRSSIDSF